MLTRRDAIHHLLRLGLLAPADLVDGSVSASEYVGRNHLVRVEVAGRDGFVVKEPKVAGVPDAATMWIEAAIFWSAANDAEFAPLARALPRYHHYDEANGILTTELVAPARSLYELLAAGTPPAAQTFRELGRVFGALHGDVSHVLRRERVRRIFRTGPAWALTLGTPQQAFTASTEAGRVLLARVLGTPGLPAALELARAAWRDAHVIHGDAKATNVLVRADGSISVIDWEIAAIGDGLWDVAGLVHSLLIPTLSAPVDDLERAQERARPSLDALWDAYVAASREAPPGDDPLVTMLRLAGIRLIQTCLETTAYTERIDPLLEGTLRMGLELATAPERSSERWERAA
ncbi:MAG TPA: phosphotransferase [Candidatus Baltobacteraceae bacterium]|nr:phosphotransferase [Candidatus Baltobacteraceae bacterium]